MKSKYQKYYDKLKNQLFSSYISRYTSTISTVKSKINSISNSISSNSTNWNEKGLNTIQNNTIPVIIKNVSNVENGINALSQAVAKSYNLLSKLTELDSVCKKYDSSLEEDKLKYENQIASLENQIDSIIDEINSISITSTNINKNNFVESSDDVNIVSNINQVKSNISTKKIDFLGNVDDLTQYTVADNYKTINLSDLINNDPIETINYIRELKATQNIDYIRVKFDNLISPANKMAINNTFRNDDTVTLEFFSPEREIARQAEQKLKEDNEKFSFLLDPRLTDEQKFVMWVNYLKNDEKFLTIEELENILKEG